MMKKYTPAWRDSDGNRLITPADGFIQESAEESNRQQRYIAPIFDAIGLQPDGTYEFECEDNGEAFIEHTHIEARTVFHFLCIDGPDLEIASDVGEVVCLPTLRTGAAVDNIRFFPRKPPSPEAMSAYVQWKISNHRAMEEARKARERDQQKPDEPTKE